MYVITLSVSVERVPLTVPFRHELGSFSVFRSQVIEAGRPVHRLHVGYFASEPAARHALEVVQRHYPDAHIITAPLGGLGSLDDTALTQFSVAQHTSARVVSKRPAEPDPTASSDHEREYRPLHPAPAADAQQYALELEVLASGGASKPIARLAVFTAYILYRAKVSVGTNKQQSLRLGFFRSLHDAQRIAIEVRDRFPQASVVPVSEREYDRVRDLASARVLDDAPARLAMSWPPGGVSLAATTAQTMMRETESATATSAPGLHPEDSTDDLDFEFWPEELNYK